MTLDNNTKQIAQHNSQNTCSKQPAHRSDCIVIGSGHGLGEHGTRYPIMEKTYWSTY